MNRYDSPSSRCNSCSRLMICARIDTSSALTASSAMITAGLSASARASPTRWRCPPDSSCGYRRACTGDSPTTSSSSRTRWRRSARVPMWLTRSGSAMLAPARHFGSSDAVGSWKTIWSWVRSARYPPSFASSARPRNRIVPDVGRMSPTMARPSVVLPLPDSPTSPSVSAAASPRVMPSTACTCPTVRRNTAPRVIGKCTRRSRTSSSAGPPADRDADSSEDRGAGSIADGGAGPVAARGAGVPDGAAGSLPGWGAGPSTGFGASVTPSPR